MMFVDMVGDENLPGNSLASALSLWSVAAWLMALTSLDVDEDVMLMRMNPRSNGSARLGPCRLDEEPQALEE